MTRCLLGAATCHGLSINSEGECIALQFGGVSGDPGKEIVYQPEPSIPAKEIYILKDALKESKTVSPIVLNLYSKILLLKKEKTNQFP